MKAKKHDVKFINKKLSNAILALHRAKSALTDRKSQIIIPADCTLVSSLDQQMLTITSLMKQADNLDEA